MTTPSRHHAGRRRSKEAGTGRARRSTARSTAAAAVLLSVPGASGCTFTNPQMTAVQYQPADGEVVILSDGVTVSSLHVITRAEGEPGVLLARVTNAASEPAQVAFAAPHLEEVFTVPGNETLAIGGVEEGSALVIVDPVVEAPGMTLPMAVAVEGGTSETVRVPVMDGTFQRYEPYLLPPST